MPTVLELIQTTATRVTDGRMEQMLRRERLLALSNQKPAGVAPKLKVLQEHGFVWVVEPAFVTKFRHHASMAWPSGQPVPVYGRGGAAIYVGDAPAHAIDRMEEAKALGLAFQTIHSNEPLPTKFIQIDPVVVGWMRYPNIGLSADGRAETIEGDLFGVVIAAWDMDKETVLN